MTKEDELTAGLRAELAKLEERLAAAFPADHADELAIAYMSGVHRGKELAQPVPVKTYHDGKPWPVAPKPWVGLTETEVEAYDSWADFQVGCGRQTLFDMVRDIEAKLKGKNT